MKNIMAYWFDLGVDGFRVDMASSLVKNDKDKKETMRLWADMREWLDREYPEKCLSLNGRSGTVAAWEASTWTSF